MSHYPPHYPPLYVKRLQHDITLNLHLSSHNHPSHSSGTNSFESHSRLPNDEAIRESIQHFTISTNNNHTNFSRPFKPGPRHARRGGGGQYRGRHWQSSLTLPKRAINYDLAESFMDHSTNPLSADLYKIKFKHSAKQWPDGRFKNYKEKLDRLDGNMIEIICTRTIPLVPKRKKLVETKDNEQNIPITTSSVTLIDPVVQEEKKKKQVNEQTNIYANLFGGGRIPRLSSTTQPKKTNFTVNSILSTPSTLVSLLGENSTNHQS